MSKDRKTLTTDASAALADNQIDPDALTSREALDALYRLKQLEKL